MAGRNWDEIPQEDWEHLVLHVNEEGNWSLQFEYEGANGVRYEYPEQSITWDEFLYIYDLAGDLDQEIEIWSDT